MQAFLDRSIKDLIAEFPVVQNILDEYDIGCAPCTVASCLLRDVVEIHALPAEREAEMMNRLILTIDPDSQATYVVPERNKDTQDGPIRYSPPLQQLVDEHKLIKRWVALIPRVVASLDLGRAEDQQRVRDGLDFIRSYADRFHHAKEEEILFGYFDRDLDILAVMHADHERARGHVRSAVAALAGADQGAVEENLLAYRELLEEHITKEDEVLYPWMDRNLTTSQVGQLYARFGDVDAGFGESAAHFERFVVETERRYPEGE
jgi:hemerythrin-like domain-containing protein